VSVLIFSLVFRLFTALLFCISSFIRLYSSCAKTWFFFTTSWIWFGSQFWQRHDFINNIFTVKKILHLLYTHNIFTFQFFKIFNKKNRFVISITLLYLYLCINFLNLQSNYMYNLYFFFNFNLLLSYETCPLNKSIINDFFLSSSFDITSLQYFKV
jgi:hypothetical protein